MISIDCAGFFLCFVEFAADQRAPSSVLPRRSVKYERVRMKLRVEISARVVMETSDRQPGNGLTHGSAFSSPREGVVVFKVLCCNRHGLAMSRFNFHAFSWR